MVNMTNDNIRVTFRTRNIQMSFCYVTALCVIFQFFYIIFHGLLSFVFVIKLMSTCLHFIEQHSEELKKESSHPMI